MHFVLVGVAVLGPLLTLGIAVRGVGSGRDWAAMEPPLNPLLRFNCNCSCTINHEISMQTETKMLIKKQATK